MYRYRARWRVQGHQQAWLWKQAARARKGGLIGGRKAGVASGVVRRAGSLTERQPWADLGRQSSDGGEGWAHERPIVAIASRPAGPLPFANSDSAFENT